MTALFLRDLLSVSTTPHALGSFQKSCGFALSLHLRGHSELTGCFQEERVLGSFMNKLMEFWHSELHAMSASPRAWFAKTTQKFTDQLFASSGGSALSLSHSLEARMAQFWRLVPLQTSRRCGDVRTVCATESGWELEAFSSRICLSE